MNLALVIIGTVLLVMGYLVGIKKMVWLLAGYNQQRVTDKNKLARLVGITFALLGLGVLLSGFFSIKDTETIMMTAVVIILLEVAYVNIKMVE